VLKLTTQAVFILLACLAVTPLTVADDYPPQVKQTLERRCMVCHGCYDAPCQLKLDARAGLERGASKDKVYDGTRLLTAKMTRLFEDAATAQEWREKGFYPVLGDGDGKGSVIQRMLELKQLHPLPAGSTLPDSFDLSLDRKQECPKPDEFDSFAENYPLWGMPYGFPGLESAEHESLQSWLRQGAPGVEPATAVPVELAAVKKWEAYFNRDGLKEQLVSRYIFEHLFVGDIYFSDIKGSPRFYKLVRSRTPPGQAIDMIATRRPYDAPGQADVFYRLQPLRTSVMAKRHMPYALSDARMDRWNELFFEADFEVIKLPGYEPGVASNPFVAYRDLPVDARYKFMLDEAQFTIMGFIKGPVCRGQVALNVIDDHFWVVFADPNQIDADQNAEFLARESANMRLPVAESSLLISLVEWRQYASGQRKFLKAKSSRLEQMANEGKTVVNLDLIWDGDGSNENASLTIFRHTDSASVVKGLVGQTPKTAWVISYSLLERIHYLLVAGFDVYGNVAHQLETRRYMDFLRMEGEYNFLLFMPEDKRLELRDFWYREANPDVKAYVLGKKAYIHLKPDIRYRTSNPVEEFFRDLKPRLPGGSAPRYQPADPHFTKLQSLTGKPFSLMPDVSFVQVFEPTGADSVYTIIHNSAYLNNTQLFREEQRRLPVEDYLTVVKGFIGSYPNMFFQMPEDQLEDFVTAIEAVKTEADYSQLVDIYGVRRTAPWFWKLSDSFHDDYQRRVPIEAGVFDLNRYENR
jgi:hypothetical protein